MMSLGSRSKGLLAVRIFVWESANANVFDERSDSHQTGTKGGKS